MSTTVYLTIATDAGTPFHHDVVRWRPAYRHLIVHQWQPRARPCQRRELQRCRLRAKASSGADRRTPHQKDETHLLVAQRQTRLKGTAISAPCIRRVRPRSKQREASHDRSKVLPS